jgi:hypothetical protein
MPLAAYIETRTSSPAETETAFPFGFFRSEFTLRLARFCLRAGLSEKSLDELLDILLRHFDRQSLKAEGFTTGASFRRFLDSHAGIDVRARRILRNAWTSAYSRSQRWRELKVPQELLETEITFDELRRIILDPASVATSASTVSVFYRSIAEITQERITAADADIDAIELPIRCQVDVGDHVTRFVDSYASSDDAWEAQLCPRQQRTLSF